MNLGSPLKETTGDGLRVISQFPAEQQVLPDSQKVGKEGLETVALAFAGVPGFMIWTYDSRTHWA